MSASKFPTKPRGPIWQQFYIVQQGPTLLLDFPLRSASIAPGSTSDTVGKWKPTTPREDFPKAFKDCQESTQKKLEEELLKREDNLLGDAGLLSNLLDHRFRGRLLSPSNRRKATSLLLSLYKPEDGDAVLAELERFEKGTGLFSSDLVHKDMFPMTFWKRVFPDSVLASQAAVYALVNHPPSRQVPTRAAIPSFGKRSRSSAEPPVPSIWLVADRASLRQAGPQLLSAGVRGAPEDPLRSPSIFRAPGPMPAMQRVARPLWRPRNLLCQVQPDSTP